MESGNKGMWWQHDLVQKSKGSYKTFGFQPWCWGYRGKRLFHDCQRCVRFFANTHTLSNNRTKDGVNKRKIWVSLFPLEGAPAFDFFFSFFFVGKQLDISEAWVVNLSTQLHGNGLTLHRFHVTSKVGHVTHSWCYTCLLKNPNSPHTLWHRAKLTDHQKKPKHIIVFLLIAHSRLHNIFFKV